MRESDRVLDDEPWVALVYEAWSQRHPRSRTRGRPGIPAEVVLRLLALQHIFNWSFDDVEREVKASLLYRQLARVGAGTVRIKKRWRAKRWPWGRRSSLRCIGAW